jgi:hypothetical protein
MRQGEELRRRLQAALEARDVSARKASKDAGVPANTIWKILTWKVQDPGPEHLRPIAAYFGWPLDEVLAWAGYRPPSTALRDPYTELEGVLMRLGLDDEARLAIRLLAQRMGSTPAPPAPRPAPPATANGSGDTAS